MSHHRRRGDGRGTRRQRNRVLEHPSLPCRWCSLAAEYCDPQRKCCQKCSHGRQA